MQRAFEFFAFCNWKLWDATMHFWKHWVFFFSFSDYESLRIGGLVFAVVLFLMGIVLIVSKCFSALNTQQMRNAVRHCRHTVIPVCVSWPHSLPNLYGAAKQAGFCFSQRFGRKAHRCLLHNLSTQHVSLQPFIPYTLSLFPLLVSSQGSSSYLPAELSLPVVALKPKPTNE